MNCNCEQSKILSKDLEQALDVLKMISRGVIHTSHEILIDKIDTTRDVLDKYGYGKDGNNDT